MTICKSLYIQVMPWLKMHPHNPGLECVGLQLGPPQLTTIEDIRGGFEPRTRTDEVGAESQVSQGPPSYSLSTTLLGGTWCSSAPSGRGLRHSLIQCSQSPLSEQISGVSRSPDYLNNAKGSSCTCNMADSE